MGIVNRNLRQTLVYWPIASRNDFGETKFGNPIELPCRWEVQKHELRDPSGNSVTTNGVAYTNTELELGCRIQLTTLAELDTNLPTEEARQVLHKDQLPSLNGIESLNVAYF